MPIDRVVVNSSPLIVLFSSGQEVLLGQLWHEVLVPGAVWREVLAGGPQDPAAQQWPTISWARQVEVPVIAPVIAAWDLGLGESEVLTFALTHPGYRAMVDVVPPQQRLEARRAGAELLRDFPAGAGDLRGSGAECWSPRQSSYISDRMTVALLFNGIKQLQRFRVVPEQTVIVPALCSQILLRALLRQR